MELFYKNRTNQPMNRNLYFKQKTPQRALFYFGRGVLAKHELIIESTCVRMTAYVKNEAKDDRRTDYGIKFQNRQI